MSRTAAASVSPDRAAGGFVYARHRPELTTLHRVVSEHLETLRAAFEEGGSGAGLPAFVVRELERYIDCGLLSRGYDGALLAEVARLFADSVLGWYRRRMDLGGIPGGRSGAVVVIQRSSSDLALNPHLHGLFLDGVYRQDGDGELSFHALPRLRTGEVSDVLQVVRVRLVRLLVRRGVLADDPDLTMLEDELSSREPALAQLAASALRGLPPEALERRRATPIELPGHPGVAVRADLSVAELGFSLHAATRAGGWDERGREALCKYVLRPPLASERLSLEPGGLVRLTLKKPFSDGTVALAMDPLTLLARLCAAIPPPRRHTVLYSGVLAPAAKWRSRIVPERRPHDGDAHGPGDPCSESHDSGGSCGHRPAAPSQDCTPSSQLERVTSTTSTCAPAAGAANRPPRHRPWASLLARTFGIDVLACPTCGSRLKLHALVNDGHQIGRILRHLGEPTEPPRLSPARGPPFDEPRVLRRIRADEPELPQRELFQSDA